MKSKGFRVLHETPWDDNSITFMSRARPTLIICKFSRGLVMLDDARRWIRGACKPKVLMEGTFHADPCLGENCRLHWIVWSSIRSISLKLE